MQTAPSLCSRKSLTAAPPIRELRWKAPRRAENWKGVWQADKFGPACLQTEVFGNLHLRAEQFSEDCLFLNVWVPNRNTKTKFPVIVWLYGGGFVTGDSSEPRYDGENLAKKGAVVVIPNYRLGVFGFFSHTDLTKNRHTKLRETTDYSIKSQLYSGSQGISPRLEETLTMSHLPDNRLAPSP